MPLTSNSDLYPNDPSPYWMAYPPETDGDGWWDNSEQYNLTTPWLRCNWTYTNNDEDPDAWPPDFNDSRIVNITDLLTLKPVMGSSVPPTSPRYDIVISGSINISDVLALDPVFGTACSN